MHRCPTRPSVAPSGGIDTHTFWSGEEFVLPPPKKRPVLVGPENLIHREIIEAAARPETFPPAMNFMRSPLLVALACFRTCRQLAGWILALRHQLGVLKRSVGVDVESVAARRVRFRPSCAGQKYR